MAVQNSINTNPGVFVALRTLNSVNRDLDVSQNRVSTGLKVSGALDDASNFSIAQGIRGELKAIGAVTQGLNNAKGIGKVAIAGATAVSDLLSNVRTKLTELSNEGITTAQRAILTDDFNQLLSQAANFIDNATFNGVNLLDTAGASTDINTLSNLSGGTLTLTAQDLRTTVVTLAGASVADASAAQNVLSNEYANLESVVNTALGSLGAEVRALDLQTSFLEQISDATEEGLGNIVDADLARESARLTALQVQQQLSIQTLGIANQRPQSLLGLFR
ncbi:flagellin [Thalassobaculum fulvum]|uniref:Flagellin n=1 Tax=Thalassobaculum fulvum TaxID=1633335 RepID=A0A918XX97_9PROT|nr:flagellin [Thalassobaculum fulvum]GHD60889.1 flagellin [Thalassobaculum fulvum]